MKKSPRLVFFGGSILFFLLLLNNTISIEITSPSDGSIFYEDDFPLSFSNDFELNQNNCADLYFGVDENYGESTTENTYELDDVIAFDEDLTSLSVFAVCNVTESSEENIYYVNPEKPILSVSSPINKKIYSDDSLRFFFQSSEKIKFNITINGEVRYIEENFVEEFDELIQLDQNQENEINISFINEIGVLDEKIIKIFHLNESIQLEKDKGIYSKGDTLSATVDFPIKSDFSLLLKANEKTVWSTDINSREEFSFNYNFDDESGNYSIIINSTFSEYTGYNLSFSDEFTVSEDAFSCEIDSRSIFGLDEKGLFAPESVVKGCEYLWEISNTTHIGKEIEFQFTEPANEKIRLICNCDGFNMTSSKDVEVVEDFMLQINLFDSENNPLNEAIITINNKDYFFRENPFEVSLNEGTHDLEFSKDSFLDKKESITLNERKKEVDITLKKPSELKDDFNITDFNYSVSSSENYDHLSFRFNFTNEEIYENCILFKKDKKNITKPLASTDKNFLKYSTFLVGEEYFQINCYNSLGGLIKKEVFFNYSEREDKRNINKSDVENISFNAEEKEVLEVLGYNYSSLDFNVQEDREILLEYHKEMSNMTLMKLTMNSLNNDATIKKSLSLFEEFDHSLFYGNSFPTFIQRYFFYQSLIDSSSAFHYDVYLLDFAEKESDGIKTIINIDSSRGAFFRKPKNFYFDNKNHIYNTSDIYFTEKDKVVLLSKEKVNVSNLKLEGYIIANRNLLSSSIPLIYFLVLFLFLVLLWILYSNFRNLIYFNKKEKNNSSVDDRKESINKDLGDSLISYSSPKEEKGDSKRDISNPNNYKNNSIKRNLFTLLNYMKVPFRFFENLFLSIIKKINSSKEDTQKDNLSKTENEKSLEKFTEIDEINGSSQKNNSSNSVFSKISNKNIYDEIGEVNEGEKLKDSTQAEINNESLDYVSFAEDIMEMAYEEPNKAYERYLKLKKIISNKDFSSNKKLDRILFEIEMYFSNYIINQNDLK